MLSTTDGCILDVAFRGFYSAFFFRPLLLSDEGPAVEGHAPCIIYSCAFDSPHAYAGHLLQVGVPIVVITFWLGHEGIQTGAQVGYPSRPGPAQSSTWRPIFSETQSREGSADAHRHARIKCGVGSPAIRSQSLFPQFTPHFTVLDIWSGFGIENAC